MSRIMDKEFQDKLEVLVEIFQMGRQQGQEETKEMLLEFAGEAYDSMQGIRHNNPLSFKDVCIELLKKY